MKVYELMEKLSRMDAGADVFVLGKGDEAELLDVVSAHENAVGYVTLFTDGYTLGR